jgi:hypothetical protein
MKVTSVPHSVTLFLQLDVMAEGRKTTSFTAKEFVILTAGVVVVSGLAGGRLSWVD